MKSFSKYFTPPLTFLDRNELFQCLGLGKLSYHFIEVCRGTVLKEQKVVGLDAEPFLSNNGCEYGQASIKGLPIIRCSLGRDQLKRESLLKEKTLWAEIFPYPLSLLAYPLSGLNEPYVEVSPPAFWNEFKGLSEAFGLLEKELAKSELSLLWLRGNKAGFPLLFHYVRRKRVRVGTAKPLRDIAEKYLKGLQNVQSLMDFFGTRTSFHCLDLNSPQEPKSSVGLLTDSIHELLSRASSDQPIIEQEPPSQELGL